MLSADVSCRIFTRIFFSLVRSQRSSRGCPLMHMNRNWRVSLFGGISGKNSDMKVVVLSQAC